MKIWLIVFVSLLALNMLAQENVDSFERRFGIGVTFGQDMSFMDYYGIYTYPASFGNIFFPIDLSPTFRIEPEIGYFSSKSKIENQETSYINLRVGLGFLGIKSYHRSNILYGIRLGLILDESEDYYNNINSTNDLYFGFTTGCEYALSKHIGIGGEAQLNYIILDTDSDDHTSNFLSTRALIVLRFYY